jgi:hypothetical protein
MNLAKKVKIMPDSFLGIEEAITPPGAATPKALAELIGDSCCHSFH